MGSPRRRGPEAGQVEIRVRGQVGDIASLMPLLQDAAQLGYFTMTDPSRPYPDRDGPCSRVYLTLTFPPGDAGG